MADYRMLVAQGKQLVFSDERKFSDLWHEILANEALEFDAELIDGDDRYMGHVAVQRAHVIGLFEEMGRRLAGR